MALDIFNCVKAPFFPLDAHPSDAAMAHSLQTLTQELGVGGPLRCMRLEGPQPLLVLEVNANASMTITITAIYFKHPSRKLKLSFDLTH